MGFAQDSKRAEHRRALRHVTKGILVNFLRKQLFEFPWTRHSLEILAYAKEFPTRPWERASSPTPDIAVVCCCDKNYLIIYIEGKSSLSEKTYEDGLNQEARTLESTRDPEKRAAFLGYLSRTRRGRGLTPEIIAQASRDPPRYYLTKMNRNGHLHPLPDNLSHLVN